MLIWNKRRSFALGLGLALLLAAGAYFITKTRRSSKLIIGAVEEVVIEPWGIKLTARVDSGAATSSLYVNNVKAQDKQISFCFPVKFGGQCMTTQLLEWRKVKSSDGIEERRAVVELEIRLGRSRFRTQFTLDDRAHMSFPMLLGRRALKGRFLVDVERTNAAWEEPAGDTPE